MTPRRVLRTSLSVTAALAALAPAARAAAPWSAPVDTGPPSNGVRVIGLGFTPAGADVVGWTRGFTSVVAPGRSTFPPGTEHPLAAPLTAGPAFDARGRGVVMTALYARTTPAARTGQRIAWAPVSARGGPGRLRALATATNLSSGPELAVNARGDAIAAWTEQIVRTARGASSYRTWASYRRNGGAFGRPVLVFSTPAREDPNPISVAIGHDGRAVVVEANTSRIHVRMRTARRPFGTTYGFGFQHGLTRTAAAISGRGRTIVVWGTQDAGEEANQPWIVSAARLRAGAGRFSEQTLDHGGAVARPEGEISLAIGRDEEATAAWSAIERGPGGLTFPVMTARGDRAGYFARKRELAPSGAVGDVAVRADGAVVVAWASVRESQVTVQAQAAIRRGRSVRFGPVEALGPADLATPPRVAFNPRTGQIVAAWSGGAGSIAPDAIRPPAQVLRVATRPAP